MNNRNILVITCIIATIIFGSFLGCSNTKKVKENAITELGRYLFYDRRLSINNSKACATCHNPQFAFTDGYKRSLGVYADLHQRNTQPLFNLSYLKYLTAADSTLHFIIQQMNNPLFNEHPKEMGVKGHENEILERIKVDAQYQQLFANAFSSQKDIVKWENIKTAISSFISSITSANTAYDRYKAGDSNTLSLSQKNGMQLFFSDRLKCSSCHGGFNFSSSQILNDKKDTINYFNMGLYNIDGQGAYPGYDMGLYQLTNNKNDMGKFRVPSLRNLTFTAPYFHDGSAASLSEVIDIYASGGRVISEGIYAGNGQKSPYKDSHINGFTITGHEKIDLIDFLQSLADSSLITNPKYANPFAEDETKKKY